MTTGLPFFESIEQCVAYLPSYESETMTDVELEFDASDMANFEMQSEALGCTVEVFLVAVLTMHIQNTLHP